MSEGPVEFSVESKSEEDRLTLCVSGYVDWESAQKLRDHLYQCQIKKTVVIDLTNVCSVTSGGLAILIDIHSTLSIRGSTLEIRNPTPTVYNVFRIAHLEDFLHVQQGE
ncbi:MAG TPA: STAS domain-containing protein [bacterium]|nr:STAS domain-containing protein [bacterium]HPO09367.1 STAS domain-containing protein [bacterium]HQO34884.1 STAS domain-containing protein [bacterium]HQP99059.1 STAS domain-containing protein [bacterium]